MKYLFLLITCFALQNTGCKKNNDCTSAIVTQSGTVCNVWGIKINGIAYPSGTIPVSYQQEGLVVCINYELYEDFRLCACCGGTWANIKSIKAEK